MTNVTATVLHGQIYAFGIDEHTCYSQFVERYDPRMDKWELLPNPIPPPQVPDNNQKGWEQRLLEPGTCIDIKISFIANGSVYAATKSQLFRFDPHANTWEMLTVNGTGSDWQKTMGTLAFVWHV